VDAARLRQVLYNYASNALKFSPPGGRVVVRARADDAVTFRVEVEDSGPGITPEDIGKLFVEFQQLHGGKLGGTGLGLAVTKRLVEGQGGTVGVRSAPGQGTTFHALLPRNARNGVALPRPRFVPGARVDAPVVLVVEDDAADQDILVRTLTQAGYAVDTAATSAQALVVCRERSHDAITLDLLLPGGSGLKVLEAVRTGSRNQDVPVVIVSIVAEGAAVTGLAVHDALSKPLDPKRLLASLERAGVPPSRDGWILVVDDDAGARGLMETSLAQLGYRATGVEDGARGLEAANAWRPLAVVLDLLMPGMDGFAFLERFREPPENRDIPVIIWTIKDLAPGEERKLRASAQEVVKKDPLGTAGFIAALGRIRSAGGAR